MVEIGSKDTLHISVIYDKYSHTAFVKQLVFRPAKNSKYFVQGKIGVFPEKSCHSVAPSIEFDVAEDRRITVSGLPVSRRMFGLSLVLTGLQEDQYRKCPYLCLTS